jgi:hypothetical protein
MARRNEPSYQEMTDHQRSSMLKVSAVFPAPIVMAHLRIVEFAQREEISIFHECHLSQCLRSCPFIGCGPSDKAFMF